MLTMRTEEFRQQSSRERRLHDQPVPRFDRFGGDRSFARVLRLLDVEQGGGARQPRILVAGQSGRSCERTESESNEKRAFLRRVVFSPCSFDRRSKRTLFSVGDGHESRLTYLCLATVFSRATASSRSLVRTSRTPSSSEQTSP